MKQRRRLLLTLVLLLLWGGFLLIPGVRWPIYGWLRGEAFYQDMPTSWWAHEIEESSRPFVIGGGDVAKAFAKARFKSQSFWDRVKEQLKSGRTRIGLEFDDSLLDGDPASLPVLLELVQSKSPKVRRAAITGLAAQKSKPEVVAALLVAIHDPDEQVRLDAIAVLQAVDPDAAAKVGVK